MKQNIRKLFLLEQFDSPYARWLIVAKTREQAEAEGERCWRAVAGGRPMRWTIMPVLPPRRVPGAYDVNIREAWTGTYPDLEIPYRPEFDGRREHERV